MTGDEAQGTMGSRKEGRRCMSRSFSPSRLPLHANFHRERERERETSGYEAEAIPSKKKSASKGPLL